jgi:hypothetical protein
VSAAIQTIVRSRRPGAFRTTNHVPSIRSQRAKRREPTQGPGKTAAGPSVSKGLGPTEDVVDRRFEPLGGRRALERQDEEMPQGGKAGKGRAKGGRRGGVSGGVLNC